MSTFIVMLERQGQPLQRLELVARDQAAAILVALELEPQATTARVLLEGQL
jgi:hypothetical protein